MALSQQLVILTTGDIDGIGQEITLKSLQDLSPKNKSRIIIVSSNKNKWPRSVGPFKLKFATPSKPLVLSNMGKDEILVISKNKSPHSLVKYAAELALKNSATGAALVTAPMSKSRLGEGHTEILKKVSGNSELYMGFLGRNFNVCLATTHIAVDRVYDSLNKQKILGAYAATQTLQSLSRQSNDLIVLGLNPHSGENGAISNQDLEIQKTLHLKNLTVPDAAFVNYRKNSTFLAWYHDQGLIPFKMAHGFAHGIQVTLGLPFIRTSVDHGTAKDLFGKGIADHRSMYRAIKTAITLVENNRNSLIKT